MVGCTVASREVPVERKPAIRDGDDTLIKVLDNS